MSLLQTNGFSGQSQNSSFPKLQSFDSKVSLTLYRNLGSKMPRGFLLFFEHMGGPILFPAVALAGLFPSNSIPTHFRTFCFNLFLGFLTDLALVGGLKFIFRRPRPSHNDSGDYCLVVDVDRYSFPSGHASRSLFVALACMVWHLGRWWFRLLILWWAIVTSMSRVLLGRHYFLDIVAGAAIAFLNVVLISKGTFDRDRWLIPPSIPDRLFSSIRAKRLIHP